MVKQNTHEEGMAQVAVYLESIKAIVKDEDGYGVERAALVERFTNEVVDIYDPDAVDTFLAWKENPLLDTLMNLAAKLDDTDDIEAVVALTENLLADERTEGLEVAAQRMMLTAAYNVVPDAGGDDAEVVRQAAEHLFEKGEKG